MRFLHCSSLAHSEEDPRCSLGWNAETVCFKGEEGEGRMKHLECAQISSRCPAWLPGGDRNLNADPHRQALLQLQLDKDANKEECLLRQGRASGKLAAATGEET